MRPFSIVRAAPSGYLRVMRCSPIHACAWALLLTLAPAAQAQPVYTDVTDATGTEDVSYGRGSAMVDLDGDTLLDLITGNANMPNLVFRQKPDHTFEIMNETWGFGMAEDLTWGTIVCDFDNDGDPDVLYVNGTAGGYTRIDACQLFRNDLSTAGVFTDVTQNAGDLATPSGNFGGTVLDYDNDGDLDVFLSRKVGGACRLLRNDGGLSFTDVSAAAGITHIKSYRHCSTGDIDGDGWMDIAVGALDGPNRLYRNNHDGTFTDIAQDIGVDSPDLNFGLALEDFNNDGHTDVYVPKWQQSPTGPSEIYLNNGDGTFTDVSHTCGIGGQTDMGHNQADLDLDGYIDIFVGTGAPRFADTDRLYLVVPDESIGIRVVDHTLASGLADLGVTRCHGIVFGDYDRDGDLDIYLNNGGPSFTPKNNPDTIQGNSMLRNDGPPMPWMAVTLEGTLSNRDGIGAKLVATTSDGRQLHRIHRSANGFCNTNPAEVWFGPGAGETITAIEIIWPSGIVQHISSPAMSQITHITEPECAADTNGDGVLTPADFTAWINAFNNEFDSCDQNSDSSCTPADFTAWIANYNAGC